MNGHPSTGPDVIMFLLEAIVLAIIAIIFFVLWGRLVGKFFRYRFSTIHRIKRFCKENGFTYVRVSRFPMLARLKGRHCNFYVLTDRTVLSVKYGGIADPDKWLRFKSPTSYEMRHMYRPNRYSTELVEYYTPEKKKPYRFDYRLPDRAYRKTLVPVLLLSPAPARVDVVEEDDVRSVPDGESMGECLFYRTEGFFRRLEEEKANGAKRF